MKTMITSALLGLGFGGWASATYWPGESAVWIGVAVTVLSWCALASTRSADRKGGIFYRLDQ